MPEAQGGWQAVAPSPIAFGKIRAAEGTERRGHSGAAARPSRPRRGAPTPPASARSRFTPRTDISSTSSFRPLSNRRADAYGGSFDNRTRFLRDCVAAVRGALPDSCPLFVRISATDWTEGGWDIEQSIELSPPPEGPRRRRDRLLVGRQCRRRRKFQSGPAIRFRSRKPFAAKPE